MVFTSSIRFGEKYLKFNDPDGLQLELIERDVESTNTWSFGGVQAENAIKDLVVLFCSLHNHIIQRLF